ncbi:MAG: ASCH domain-containing protein, partial [Proteobacteria bacterium]
MSHTIHFYDDLIPTVLSGDKTITIRSQTGRRYQPGMRLEVLRHSDGERVAEIEVVDVKNIHFQDLNDSHAVQEHMKLAELRELIQQIYPDI